MKNDKQENSAHNKAISRSLAKLKAMEQRKALENSEHLDAIFLATKKTVSSKEPTKNPIKPSKALANIGASQIKLLEQVDDSSNNASKISYQDSASKKTIERAASLLKRTQLESGTSTEDKDIKSSHDVLNLKGHVYDPLEAFLSKDNEFALESSHELTASFEEQEHKDSLDHSTNNSIDEQAITRAQAYEQTNDKTQKHDNSKTKDTKTKSLTKAKAARLNPKDKSLQIICGSDHSLDHESDLNSKHSKEILVSASSMLVQDNVDALSLDDQENLAKLEFSQNQSLSISSTLNLLTTTKNNNKEAIPQNKDVTTPINVNHQNLSQDDILDSQETISEPWQDQSNLDNFELVEPVQDNSSALTELEVKAEDPQEPVEPVQDNSPAYTELEVKAEEPQEPVELVQDNSPVYTELEVKAEEPVEPVQDNSPAYTELEVKDKEPVEPAQDTNPAYTELEVKDKEPVEPAQDTNPAYTELEVKAKEPVEPVQDTSPALTELEVKAEEPVEPVQDNSSALTELEVKAEEPQEPVEPAQDTSPALTELEVKAEDPVEPDQELISDHNETVVENTEASYSKVRASKANNTSKKAKSNSKFIYIAPNYKQFVSHYGASSIQIMDHTVAAMRYVFNTENDILGERYKYQLNDHDLLSLEQSLFGSGFKVLVNKQISFIELLLVLLSQDTNTLESSDNRNKNHHAGAPKYSFIKRQALTLRRIVFNNPMVDRINTSQGSDDEKWLLWRADFEKFNAKGSKEEFKLDPEHFVLLKHAFDNFDNFSKAITLLKSWAIVPNKAKNWSEHFLFPFGAESLYYDTFETTANGGVSHCANFGQLLFTMLMRARNKDHTNNALLMLCEAFFEQHEGFNVFAQLLGNGFVSYEDELIALLRSNTLGAGEKAFLSQKSTEDEQDLNITQSLSLLKEVGKDHVQECEFVPYIEHPCFDHLQEDFSQLLSLKLTKQQLLKSLSIMGMLNILVYFLEQEQKLASINNNKNKPNIDIVLSVGNKASNRVHKLSLDRLQANNKLHNLALRNFIAEHIDISIRCTAPFLKKEDGLNLKEQDLMCNLVRAMFNFATDKAVVIDLTGKGSIYEQDNVSAKVIANNHQAVHNKFNILRQESPYPNYQSILGTISDALMNHNGDLSALHRELALEIGLVSGSQKAHQYYAFSDELLRTLVLCCVDKNKSMIMLSEFLQKLYERYHLVIGPQQAHDYFSSSSHGRSNYIEEKEFKKNLNELIAQLKRMDLLINLSDSCEYVINPFSIHS